MHSRSESLGRSYGESWKANGICMLQYDSTPSYMLTSSDTQARAAQINVPGITHCKLKRKREATRMSIDRTMDPFINTHPCETISRCENECQEGSMGHKPHEQSSAQRAV